MLNVNGNYQSSNCNQSFGDLVAVGKKFARVEARQVTPALLDKFEAALGKKQPPAADLTNEGMFYKLFKGENIDAWRAAHKDKIEAVLKKMQEIGLFS